MKTLPLILIFVLTLSNRCGKDDSNNYGNPETGYELTLNNQFTIELASNPTTGYSWKWTNKQSVTVVDSVGFVYITDKPELTGSGGKEIWKFRGIKKGTDTLKFEYNRSWEPNSTVKSQTIVVRVK
jgi:inhibitor of cysteine peptidase